MEAYLRESGTPYVAVDEAKKALFAGVSLKSFDFVAYSADGPNWLITCKPFSQGDMREVMRKWEDVFGKGFAAAEVRLRHGRFVLVTLDGKAVELPPVEQPQAAPPSPPAETIAAAPTDAAPPQTTEPVRPERALFEMEP
jgi:hypothetical protein